MCQESVAVSDNTGQSSARRQVLVVGPKLQSPLCRRQQPLEAGDSASSATTTAAAASDAHSGVVLVAPTVAFHFLCYLGAMQMLELLVCSNNRHTSVPS